MNAGRGRAFEEFGVELRWIADGVRALLKETAEAEGLTPAQAQALRFTDRTKTFLASVGNLAHALGASHVTAVKVVDGLVRRGLIERTQSEWDGRVTLLSLTASGKDVVARLKAQGIRAELDLSDDRFGKKIRNASKEKVPFVLIAGGEDVEADAVSFRFRDGTQENGVPVAEAIERVAAAITSREQV